MMDDNSSEQLPDGYGSQILQKGKIHLSDGSIQVQHVEFTDSNSIEHIHKHKAYEVYFCLSGSLQMKIENTDYKLTKDQFVVIAPGIYHRVFFSKNIPSKNFLLLFLCQPGAQPEKNSLLSAFRLALGMQRSALFGTDNYHARQSIEGILAESSEPLIGSEELLQGYYLEFLTKILRNFIPEPAQRKSKDDHINLAVQITQYIKEHHTENITPQEVADSVHITLRHADRIFNEFFGTSVMKAIQLFRLAFARKELEESSVSIEEIAARVGFNSARSMQQAFREFEGMTPSEYRRIAGNTKE